MAWSAMVRAMRVTRRQSLALLGLGLGLLLLQTLWLGSGTSLRLVRSGTVQLLQRVFHMETSIPCLDPNHTLHYEDVFCLDRPDFLANFKNPCWYECKGCGQRTEGKLTSSDTNEKQRLQCLPYFHLLGVGKCGTTDLFGRITKHHQVLPNDGMLNKETAFWSWRRVGHFYARITNESLTFDHYTSVLFKTPTERIAKQSVNGFHSLVTGDATPMDFWDNLGWRAFPQNRGLREPKVGIPQALRHLYREGRFILIFRNPTQRLYSQYFFQKMGNSSESFHRDVVQALDLFHACVNTFSVWFCLTDMDLFMKLPARVTIGMYSVYLKKWLEVFPYSSFLFLRTEDYSRNISSTLRQVFQFLELEPVREEELAAMSQQERRYKTVAKHKAGPMLKETRKVLDDFYRPYNQELARILNDPRFLWEDK